MKHARDDYNDRIQDAAGRIPEDEPVFLLRGQDAVSGDAMQRYIEVLELSSADPRMIASVREQALRMTAWRVENGLLGRVPDLPADVRVITDPVAESLP